MCGYCLCKKFKIVFSVFKTILPLGVQRKEEHYSLSLLVNLDYRLKL